MRQSQSWCGLEIAGGWVGGVDRSKLCDLGWENPYSFYSVIPTILHCIFCIISQISDLIGPGLCTLVVT